MQVDEDTVDWIVSACEWWLRQFGPVGETQLALPIEEHFPSGALEELFDVVCELAGMRDWSFELVDESSLVMDDPMPHVPRPAFPAAVLTAEEEDARVEDGEPFPVPYTADLARAPAAAIASFACSLSHYLLHTAEDVPPGGEEHREAFVEIGAVLMGFGVFLANSALRFEQFDSGGLHGWSASAQRVLGEDALGYALAIFVALSATDPKLATAHLAPNPKAAFKWARKHLVDRRCDDLERLRATVPPSQHAAPYR